MTAIAATTGTIRSRVDGTLALTIEFEPAHAQDAFRLFGTPGTQVAIAALRDGSFLEQAPENSIPQNTETDKSRTNPGEKPEKPKIGDACLLAVRWCADPQFWEWIACQLPDATTVDNEAEARQFVCMVCGVMSRKELDTNHAALNIWNRGIRKPYRDYMIQKGKA